MHNKILNYIKSHKTLSIIGALIILGVAYYFIFSNKGQEETTFVMVERGSLTEEVSVTGNVKPLSDVDLAFERGGRVSSLPVSVGDRVYAGQYLASVSNADLVASLDQAKANLKKVQAQSGTESDQTALTLAQSKISLTNSIKDSYTKADDALRNKIYSLFTDPIKYNARLTFSTDTFLQEDIEEGKDITSDALDSWNRSLTRSDDLLDLEKSYQLAKTNLLSLKALLDKCATAVNGLSADSSGNSQTQIDTWKLNISTARTSINTTIDNLTSSYDQFKSAGLSVKISGNTTVAEEAAVEQAQAQIASAEAELAKSIIHSPISGVITDVLIKLGEIVSANQKAITIISYGDYEVETFVPEADIAKVKVNNLAKTTLDAYSSDIEFQTKVIKIDPAATVIDGVPTYKVTLKFIEKDERVRSGMTANLDILTSEKTDVLIVPSRMIISQLEGKTVFVLETVDGADKITEKTVITGLRGSDGMTEIISGLNEGDKVVTNPAK